ncbi:aldo/keto reductase [Rhodococcus globerulus]|uniref:aldo/keto reductase n=1 Tax=Rhodococcus globerulus TaxID=33008 RepID=UPI0039EB1B05
MTTTTVTPGAASGTFILGGDVEVNRLGYGTMHLAGPGAWGAGRDRDEALRVLRRAVELGVTFFDTADVYGPFVTDELIRTALHPYPDELVIGSKVGSSNQGAGKWAPIGRPEYLRQQTLLNLRHLGLERIDLLQLHRIDPQVPLEDQIGELKSMQDEGLVRHVGLSEVSVDEIKAASAITQIVSVQNRFNLADRASEDVLDYCTAEGIAFIPWFPLAYGKLARPGGILASLASKYDRSPSQLALAWLLRRSGAILPIPGTSSVRHLEENMESARIDLTDNEFDMLSALGRAETEKGTR